MVHFRFCWIRLPDTCESAYAVQFEKYFHSLYTKSGTTESFLTPYSDAYELIFRQINHFPSISIQRNKKLWNYWIRESWFGGGVT